MPTYEYMCNQCQHKFEVKQTFTDPPLSSCPACNASARRVFHAPAILYKSPGFHTYDSRPQKDEGKSSERSSVESTSKVETDDGSEGGEQYDTPEPYFGGHW